MGGFKSAQFFLQFLSTEIQKQKNDTIFMAASPTISATICVRNHWMEFSLYGWVNIKEYVLCTVLVGGLSLGCCGDWREEKVT